MFDSVIVDTVKTPEQYLECINDMGTTPNKTAVVDDRTVRGVQIGNKLGCITFWVCAGKYAHEKPNQETGQPTYIITSVEELLELL